ncbi:MAG: ATPase, T2SS/T4P/T4SS family [Halanaeroarchaeum sp.]
MFDFGGTDAACTCTTTTEGHTLVVDAGDCPGGGDLAASEACRRTVVEALGSDATADLRVERAGTSVRYGETAVRTLSVAGAFATRVAGYDEALADRVPADPVGAAGDAAGRVGPVAEIAAETGFADLADGPPLGERLRGFGGPAIAAARIDPDPPADGTLRSTRVLDSGATARVYEVGETAVYHLEPVEYAFADDVLATLEEAWGELADLPDGERAPHEAVAAVADDGQPLAAMGRALTKHARGYGVLDDLFADPRVDEVAVNAPADETPLQVRVDDRALATNVRLTERGARLLASRVRRESGRAFSRADPTVDALLTDVGVAPAIRVAGVRRPASDGLAFALRAEATDEWRLDRLVDLGTLTPAAAGLLSFAMDRGAAVLVAGPRGAGKTTLASALLWELPTEDRLLAIEDTPELPVAAIQAAGRDAQRLTAAPGEDAALTPAEALRTALRLGDGALAVGEVRGPEAGVLYEAMRVGAASSAVLGTIHGEGADGVRERVVSDLGVADSSFAITDLVVTAVRVDGRHRVGAIEEVTDHGAAPLFELGDDGPVRTGRVDRGNSEVVASLARPGESYAAVRSAIDDRAERFAGPGPGATAEGRA